MLLLLEIHNKTYTINSTSLATMASRVVEALTRPAALNSIIIRAFTSAKIAAVLEPIAMTVRGLTV